MQIAAQSYNNEDEQEIARCDIRLPAKQKKFMEKAAKLRGLSLKDFVISSGMEKAAIVFKEFAPLEISSEADFNKFFEILNKKEVNENALNALKRHRKHFK